MWGVLVSLTALKTFGKWIAQNAKQNGERERERKKTVKLTKVCNN